MAGPVDHPPKPGFGGGGFLSNHIDKGRSIGAALFFLCYGGARWGSVMRLFAASQEWVEIGDDGFAAVGISAFQARQFGYINDLSLPAVGDFVNAGSELGRIHGGSEPRFRILAEQSRFGGWWHPIKAPIAGTVIEHNEAVCAEPELLNSDPEGAGWLVRLRVTGLAADYALLSREQHDQQCEAITALDTHVLPKAY
jgi:glycine cleavage system H protein